MFSIFKGIDVILYARVPTGEEDGFDRPIYREEPINVSNVLVTPAETSDSPESTEPKGKHIAYTLCIPKGDTNDWTGARVEFWGKSWETVGFPKAFQEELLPLEWNKQVRVERYG